MNDEQRRALLEAVAAGEVDAGEAARRLAIDDDHDDDDGTGGAASAATGDRPAAEPDGTGARRIRIEAAGAAVRIIGDPDIAGILVDGEHEIDERDGAVVVRCNPFRNLVGTGAGTGFRIHGGGSHRRIDFGSVAAGIRTTVRMNPDLPLAIDLNAGSISVRGVHGPIDADIDAGAAHLRDVRGPIQASVNAGALTVEGRFDQGESHISCDMGATNVRLAPGSDVRVRASVDLGRCEVRLPDDGGGRRGGDYVLGGGRATLVIKGSMSAVTVATDQ
jgi:hypothetical protein